jgi:hypothetical protein|tara:strand:+ start:502 stop:732 length:231 start_codon:yes stop_codon:yes gene_type:complete
MNRDMPVFVKIEEYKDVLDVLELVKNKIVQAKDILGKINELKNEEDVELDQWRTSINDIERRVDELDETLLEPQNV